MGNLERRAGRLHHLVALAALLLSACAPPALPPALPAATVQQPAATAEIKAAPLTSIAFGSCAHQNKPQPIWDAVLAHRPDLFVFLGDNIYGDTQDPAVLRAKYAQLAAKEGFQRLRASTEVIATWDDHDYGANDAGAGFPAKDASRRAFLDFWGAPPDSPRRTQEGGIYTSSTYGPEGRRVQVILLDTRWNRTPLNRLPDEEVAERARRLVGPYAPVTDPEATLLGAAQWAWLEEQLRLPAELRIIATSIPALQMGTGFETWDNFPAERERLFALIETTQAQGILFITGDTHRAQFSRLDDGAPYPLWEINSSGLTENYDWPAPDANRLGPPFTEDNFGLITIDWSLPDPTLTLEIRAADNDIALQNTIRLSELR